MASLVKLGGVGVSNQRGDAGVQRGGGGGGIQGEHLETLYNRRGRVGRSFMRRLQRRRLRRLPLQ